MTVEAISGGDQPRDRRYPYQNSGKRPGGTAVYSSDTDSTRERVNRPPLGGSVRLVVDEHNRVDHIEIVDRDTDRVVDTILSDELEFRNYHGILVDVAT